MCLCVGVLLVPVVADVVAESCVAVLLVVLVVLLVLVVVVVVVPQRWVPKLFVVVSVVVGKLLAHP